MKLFKFKGKVVQKIQKINTTINQNEIIDENIIYEAFLDYFERQAYFENIDYYINHYRTICHYQNMGLIPYENEIYYEDVLTPVLVELNFFYTTQRINPFAVSKETHLRLLSRRDRVILLSTIYGFKGIVTSSEYYLNIHEVEELPSFDFVTSHKIIACKTVRLVLKANFVNGRQGYRVDNTQGNIFVYQYLESDTLLFELTNNAKQSLGFDYEDYKLSPKEKIRKRGPTLNDITPGRNKWLQNKKIQDDASRSAELKANPFQGENF